MVASSVETIFRGDSVSFGDEMISLLWPLQVMVMVTSIFLASAHLHGQQFSVFIPDLKSHL